MMPSIYLLIYGTVVVIVFPFTLMHCNVAAATLSYLSSYQKLQHTIAYQVQAVPNDEGVSDEFQICR